MTKQSSHGRKFAQSNLVERPGRKRPRNRHPKDTPDTNDRNQKDLEEYVPTEVRKERRDTALASAER